MAGALANAVGNDLSIPVAQLANASAMGLAAISALLGAPSPPPLYLADPRRTIGPRVDGLNRRQLLGGGPKAHPTAR